MDYTLLDDNILVRLLRTSDEKAFRQIYDRYWKKIFFTAVKKTHSKEAAEELTQNLFVSLWQKRESANILQLENYLFAAIKYSIINYIRFQATRQKYFENNHDQVRTEENPAEQAVLLHNLEECIQKGLLHLPEKTRRVFTLSRFENHSVKQIAEKLNISEKAVEYHITKSLKVLHIHLKHFELLGWMSFFLVPLP